MAVRFRCVGVAVVGERKCRRRARTVTSKENMVADGC
jgi:hypothetical protein